MGGLVCVDQGELIKNGDGGVGKFKKCKGWDFQIGGDFVLWDYKGSDIVKLLV